MNLRSLVKQLLIQKENKRYAGKLAARQVSYEKWVDRLDHSDGWEAAERSDKEPRSFQCYVAADGVVAEGAFTRIERYFREHPQVKVVYGDEDVLENGVRKSPWFKPDWSPDLFQSFFYFGSIVAVKNELAEQVPGEPGPDWVYDCVKLAGGYERGCSSIGHLPVILFHSSSEKQQQKYRQIQGRDSGLQCRASEQQDSPLTSQSGQPMYPEAQGNVREASVSIVIPSKDNPQVLRKCLEACMADAPGAEIIIVDNGSSPENKDCIRRMIEGKNIQYLYNPMPFNFSKMCNLGASAAKGECLLFLNDDVELCEPGTIARMAELATKSYVGAVGMKLYYPDSDKIQHAGITNLPMGPVHKMQFLPDREEYYFGSNRGMRDVLAVTAACLMVQRNKFKEAGGFAEELAVAFNDVDFCFTLHEKGYWNVCLNDSHAFHHESLSRGDDEAPEKLGRLLAERDRLYRRHPTLEGKDPFYSPYLNREGLDTRIRPAYETAGNEMQRQEKELSEIHLESYRNDPCVLLRIESFQNGILQGYSVVLGDNNACYDKKILLIPEAETAGTYAIPLEGQYRPDLVENMPDQTNVGLSGFWMMLSDEALDKIPAGRYRIGEAVKNRVTGLRLMNKSNRYLIVLHNGDRT